MYYAIFDICICVGIIIVCGNQKNKYATTLKSVTKFNVANTRSNFQIELMLRQECVNNLDVSNGCKNHQFYTKQ